MSAFRQNFIHGSKEITKWFPGHMATGMKQMQQKLKSVDCIIEVHDARIPITGRNPMFYNLLTAIRPHILVLNKMDLADTKYKEELIKTIKIEQKVNEVLFTNCKDHKNSGIRKILPKALELIKSSNRFNREEREESTLMVIGIPNVGKSSLINCLRALHLKRAKATQVGASPGVTRSVLEKIKMHEEPLIYLLDTPGVTSPNIKDVESGLKLALCAVLKDHLVGEDLMTDYLLYWMNKTQNFKYVDVLKLPEPCDQIHKVLLHVALQLGKTKKHRSSDGTISIRPNLEAAASYIITAFRNGDFGRINFDQTLDVIQ